MCRIEADGRERTKLVSPGKVEDKLDKNLKRGECPNPVNGRVMCKIRNGTQLKNVLVKHKQVQRKIGRGWTLGACESAGSGRGRRGKGSRSDRRRSSP